MNLGFEHFGVFLALQFAVAITAVCAGVASLRLKGWGRHLIEALCWLGIAYTLAFGMYWTYMWVLIAGGPAADVTMQWMGGAMGLVGTAIFAVPLSVMVRYVRTKAVRDAFASA